jgi:hypothetical protein
VSSLRALRAPDQEGAILAAPPLEQVGELLDENRRRLVGPERTRLGRSWREVRELARREVLALAALAEVTPPPSPLVEQTASLFPSPPATGKLPVATMAPPSGRGTALQGLFFLAGHQPELFHPGVWLKNFALAGLARRHGGVAINLVVDSDTLESPSLRVPVPASAEVPQPHALVVPFDRWTPEIPFEERSLRDPELFAGFGERITEMIRRWGYEPLMTRFWPVVLRCVGEHGLIGEAFAAARRDLEHAWGCHNLEVPISRLCGTESFAFFAGAILDELPRFVAAYNRTVRDYRARNAVRSRNHPVPDLVREGDWHEAPFWGWRAGQGRRGRLFVRSRGDRLHLRAGEQTWPDLPKPGHPDFVAAWVALGKEGYKVRTRALTTTLFSRLLVADLFLHGIGGGKYDELTDELIRNFFQLEAPAFLVLSGTLRLPLPVFPVTLEQRRRLTHQLREIRYNPQRHLSEEQAESMAELLRDKQRWIEERPDTRIGRRRRFAELRSINERLHAPLVAEDARLVDEIRRTDRQLRSNAVMRRRDYSFCLFPERLLEPFCTALL